MIVKYLSSVVAICMFLVATQLLASGICEGYERDEFRYKPYSICSNNGSLVSCEENESSSVVTVGFYTE